jgi:SulP family sulfate permease
MVKDLGSVFLFGLINTFMLVPVSISFCAIIFRDEAFDKYMPSLVKLVLFSSALHQACFSLFSSLPFAVGQVQDAGLIFLSAMAGSIAASCSKPENIVPSTLYILGLSTAILGVMLMIVSKLRLASVVQYLPMPVIGGYLAFIGFFCGEAGLSMMAGVQVTNITQWNKFLNQDALVLLMPGLICGLGMSYCLHKFRSPLTFPLCLLSILSIFYLSMLFSGSSLQDMRDAGWIAPLDKAGSSFDAWKLYDISKVEWELFPKQIITLLGMFFVVAFSSSLDVAAIEMELGIPLDYNRELNTVGISNLVSGLLGGYTGSYIFTQTTFNMRRGINNRLCGFIIVIGEIVIALLPVSVVSFIPKMFFGSLLVLIATELLCEWLIFTHSKMMLYEYAVCLLTFVCIQMVGIEVGMLLGVIAAMFCFVISYSNLQSVSAVTVKSSTVIRTFEERSVLIANRGKVLTVSLSGYLFFGSAVKLLQEIKSKLAASDCDDEPSSISPGADGYLPISTFLGTLKDPAASASLSPPPSVPKLLSRGSLGGALPSLIDAAPTASTNKGNNGNSSAFTEMNPLIAISKQSSFKSPSRQDQVPALVGSASSQAPASYQQQQQLRVGHTHADEATASSHHPMKMLFSSHSLRQKHIPTVYDLSAEQIQSHYQSWTNSSRPLYERNFDPRDCRTDLEMGNLSHQQMSSIPRTTTSDRCNDTLIKDSILTTPVNERTSLLTAAINNSYSKEAAGKTRDTATPKSQHRELIDAQEIRETSVFLQVWESQQQRKEQQRRRQSYSDLVGLSSSLGNREQLDTVDRIKIGLGYNFDSEENLEDLNKTPCENSEIDSNENGHESASKGFSIKSNADPIASGKIRQSTTYTSPVPLTQPMQGMLQAPPSHIAVNAQSQDMVTEYLILDFTEVIGVDATAARACFLTLVHFMRTANVTVVFANLSKPVQELLCAHNVLNEESIIIPNLDDALEWCEDQILVE